MRLPRKIKKAWKQCQKEYPRIALNTKWKLKCGRYARGVMLIPKECVANFELKKWIEYAREACLFVYRHDDDNPYARPVYHENPKAELTIGDENSTS